MGSVGKFCGSDPTSGSFGENHITGATLKAISCKDAELKGISNQFKGWPGLGMGAIHSPFSGSLGVPCCEPKPCPHDKFEKIHKIIRSNPTNITRNLITPAGRLSINFISTRVLKNGLCWISFHESPGQSQSKGIKRFGRNQ
jgi:hypothetical protein